MLLNIDGEEMFFDHLIIDDKGILPIKRYGWGTALYGTADTETWKMKDQYHQEVFPNPLLDIRKNQITLNNFCGRRGVYGLHYKELVILADTFDEPRIFLGDNAPVVSYNKIKAEMKKRTAMPTLMPNHKEVTQLIMDCQVERNAITM